MRVLHLFDWYLPSTLSWVSRLLLQLKAEEVQIAAPWIVQNSFYHPTLRHYYFPLQRCFFSKVQSEWDYPLFQRLFARSQRFLPIYPYWLERQLRAELPDILHAHFGPTGCLYLPLAKKINRPLVVTFYGFDYQKLLHDRPVFKKKYRRLFAAAAQIIAASPTGCEALVALGCPPEKLAVVRPSPDLTLFPFTRREKKQGQLRMVQVATFTEKKGHQTTLEALRKALPDFPNLHLTLAGERYDAALVRQLEEYIRHHGLQQHIAWVDPIPHGQMAAFLGGFDVFVHPSCHTKAGDHEASPVVLMEAQATGLPVLATRHFDLPDLVAHGQTGWLVAEQDSDDLARTIRRFYDMGGTEYMQFSQAARSWIEQEFTVERSAGQLQNIYRKLL